MTIKGRLIVVPGADIDTDRIMPARFLKSITFSGLEAHIFEDDRASRAAQGDVHPFDNPANAGASILVAGPNFGCGSSREHAPQALHRWGITAIVAPSFGEIFVGNSTAIGLVCATIDLPTLTDLSAKPEGLWHLSLETMTMTDGVRSCAIDMPVSRRHALRSGEWDATAILLSNYEDVDLVDARLPYLRATSRNA
jgi:3-isopropylmalate/(R)-2-methylmalate dehydratase small subunit